MPETNGLNDVFENLSTLELMAKTEMDPKKDRRKESLTKFAKITKNKVKPLENKKKTQQFEVLWHKLSYGLRKIPLMKKKLILRDLNGCIKSGELTAIMGPSGAGKSTLLEIICGRRKQGVTGDIRIRGVKDIKVGFVPQDNHLMESLTVKETFIFTSKLRNVKNPNTDHKDIAQKMITRFGLEAIADTRACRCSGGQRKRLSIALEVLSKPNILILDEPTTGLDSPSCTHVMNVMKELVVMEKWQSRAMAIITTIHQPSIAVFNSFQRIYILTSDGQCLYQGNPSNLLPTLSEVGLICDEFTSPADYIIEIASGDYGENAIKKLVSEAQTRDIQNLVTTDTQTLASISGLISHPFWDHWKILFLRTQVILYRDPFLTVIRIGMTLFTAISLSLLFGKKIGSASGCPPRELELYTTSLVVLSTKFETDLYLIMQNVCMLFLGLMIGLIGGLAPVLLNFPIEMHVFMKEYHNGWYSCISYYVAKVFSDIPLQIISPLLYIIIIHNYTGQPPEVMREINLLLIAVLMSLTAQSIGEIVSAIWMDNQSAAVFAGGIIPLPMILFGGFLVKVSKMPFYLQPLSWLSFLRFAFEAMLVSTYGFDRCNYDYENFLKTINVSAITKPLWAQYLPIMLSYIDKKPKNSDFDYFNDENNTISDTERLFSIFAGSLAEDGKKLDMNKSLILSYYEIDDLYFFRAIGILVAYLVVFKIITYYILLAKLHSKK